MFGEMLAEDIDWDLQNAKIDQEREKDGLNDVVNKARARGA